MVEGICIIVASVILTGGGLYIIATAGADPDRIRGPWWDRSRYDRWRELAKPWGIVRFTGFFVAGYIVIFGSIAALTGTDAAINQAVGLGGLGLLVLMPIAFIIDLVRKAIRARR